MIAFILYFFLFTFLIYKYGFFGIFRDEKIRPKTYTLIFLVKALAVPAFYFLFVKLYGGIEKLDAGKFYSDAKIINGLAYENFGEYLKMLFGLQDDSEGSFFYKTCIVTTDNWDNGLSKDFFYNDNRIVIRIHSLIHFIAFNSYFAHALFSCLFSFIGLSYLYKTFKEYFNGLELYMFIAICLFPTLWLYTGGLLKEGITILFLGFGLYQLKKLIILQANIFSVGWMILVIGISLLLKPYLLFYSLIYFSVFFFISSHYKKKYKVLIFFNIILALAVLINTASVLVKNKSLPTAAIEREREFSDLAKGGIFLLDSNKFVRLPYNYNLLKMTGDKKHFFIKKNVSYTYWEHSHQKDTLFCQSNLDTVTKYTLVYDLPTAGSNIDIVSSSTNFFVMAGKSLYYTLAYPFFFNAKSSIQLLASLENLILITSILVILLATFYQKTNLLPLLAFLFFALSLFIVIGITTPNSGAILRYRSPAAIFILLSALYSLKGLKKPKL